MLHFISFNSKFLNILMVNISKNVAFVKELELMDNRLVKAMLSKFVFMFKFSML